MRPTPRYRPAASTRPRRGQAIEEGHRRLQVLAADADGLALGEVSFDHPFFGPMTVYQWVELMAAHEGRHTDQIKEIAAIVA
jgi:hypothetical protein